MRRFIVLLLTPAPFVFHAMSGCSSEETKNDAGSDSAPDVSKDVSRDVTHRVVAIDCNPSRPPGQAYPDLDSGCVTDDDCDAGVNGRCIGLASGCSACVWNACSYDTCMSDDACAGHACACREAFPTAYNWPDFCDTIGNCRVDSDCPSGFCSASFVSGCAPPAYYCRTSDDECIADVDCKDGGYNHICGFDAVKKRWTCQHQCVDG